MPNTQYWVFVDNATIKYGQVKYPYWISFDNLTSALLFKKIYGYSLIAKGK